MELAGHLLIHTEQIANLTSAYADVASWHVHVGANHLVQLAHEGLTETHHLIVTLAAYAEVATTFTTTHRQCGQCVLEGLFEAEELQDAQVY